MLVIDPPLNRVDKARVVFGVVGVAAILVGGIAVLAGIPVSRYPGIALWLIAAIVLHDGVLAPLVVLFGAMGRPAARALGFPAATVIRTTLVTVAIVSLASIPALAGAAIGNKNPTIHTNDYTAVLAIMWAIAGALVVASIVIGAVFALRRRTRVARTR